MIRRGALTKALREAAIRSGVAIKFSKQLADVVITPGRTVTARFEDGSEAYGDLLKMGVNSAHQVYSYRVDWGEDVRVKERA